jgi:hypothetical protein
MFDHRKPLLAAPGRGCGGPAGHRCVMKCFTVYYAPSRVFDDVAHARLSDGKPAGDMLGEYEVMFSPAHVFSSVAMVPTTAHLLKKQVGDC